MKLSILLVSLVLPTIIHGIEVSKIGSCHHMDMANGERLCVHIVPKAIADYYALEHECASIGGSLPKVTTETELLALKRILFWRGSAAGDSFYLDKSQDKFIDETKTSFGIAGSHPILNVKENTIVLSHSRAKLPLVCFRPFMPKIKCNHGFQMYDKTGACFKAFTAADRVDGRGYNASECHQHCLSLKSQMAVFDSKEEMDFVFGRITKNKEIPCVKSRFEYHCTGFWTGHRLPAKNAPGTDCTGDKLANCVFNMDGSKYQLEGDQWDSGEPNAAIGTNPRGEHCIEVMTIWPQSFGKWNDLACKVQNGCLCRHQADRT